MSGVYGAQERAKIITYQQAIAMATRGRSGSGIPDGYPTPETAGLSDPFALTNMGGSTISTPGITIENKRIYGSVRVTVDGVTFRNCEFNIINGYYGIDADGSEGLTVEHCHFKGTKFISRAIVDGGNSLYSYNLIEGCVDGQSITQGSRIEESLIWNLAPYDPILDTHNDGIQGSITKQIEIVHNTIIVPAGATSAILLGGGEGRPFSEDVLIDGNYLDGGGFILYLTYGESVYGQLPAQDIVVTNNRFGPPAYGYVAQLEPDATTFTGNLKLDGSPLSLAEATQNWSP